MSPELIAALMAALEQLISIWKGSKNGTLSEADAIAALQSFVGGLAANNAAADAALAAKFGTKP